MQYRISLIGATCNRDIIVQCIGIITKIHSQLLLVNSNYYNIKSLVVCSIVLLVNNNKLHVGIRAKLLIGSII